MPLNLYTEEQAMKKGCPHTDQFGGWCGVDKCMAWVWDNPFVEEEDNIFGHCGLVKLPEERR